MYFQQRKFFALFFCNIKQRLLTCNRCYLSDFINENFGMNFRTLLNGYRTDYARQLMEENQNLTVTEISKLCGFATIRSFNRAFLKATGFLPRDHKKRD